MDQLIFPVLIEKDEDGYFATCPSLQGCYTQGGTYEEVLVNIQDAISLHLQDRLAAGEPLPHLQSFSLATVSE
jgi:predicted RNase H-like HicB family nuclease